MSGEEQRRAELRTAVSAPVAARDAADELCRACVGVLEVDGASTSLTPPGTDGGTSGARGDLGRRPDALPSTSGEGPCLDAVRDGWPHVASSDRVEVHQATGMIMATLDVDAVEALVRLRAQAFARRTTAAELAREIVERRVPLASPDRQGPTSRRDPARPDRPSR